MKTIQPDDEVLEGSGGPLACLKVRLLNIGHVHEAVLTVIPTSLIICNIFLQF